jgi:hypothetical protein
MRIPGIYEHIPYIQIQSIRLRRCLVQGVFLVLFLTLTVDIVRSDQGSESGIEKTIVQNEHVAFDRRIVGGFRDALGAIQGNRISDASQKLVEIRKLADGENYNNIPDFSFDLIRKAKDQSLDSQTRLFLLDHAERLSPDHPGVLLSLSSAHKEFGISRSVSYLAKSLTTMSQYPLTMSSLIGRGLVYVIFALFISVFVATLLYLVSSSGELFISIATHFPRKTRGIMASVVFSLCLFLPLFLPFLLALSLWIVVLTVFSRRYKWLTISAGVMILSCLYGLPFAAEVIALSESTISRTLENVSNKNFMPRAQDNLDSMVLKDATNPMVLVVSGQLLQERGKIDAAKNAYARAKESAAFVPGLRYLTELNLGVHAYKTGNTSEAFAIWKKLYEEGWVEFELLYNLSIASLSNFDKEKHDFYFEIMRNKFYQKYEVLAGEQGEKPAPVLGQLPKIFLIDIVNISHRTLSHKKVPLDVFSYTFMARDGSGVFSEKFYTALAFLLFITGICQFRSSRVTYRYRGSLVTERIFFSLKKSMIWKYLPFGWCLTENKELSFLISFTFVLFCFLIATGVPFSLAHEQIDRGILVVSIPAVVVLILNIRPWAVSSRSEG